ncbi:MAG: glycosyl transferase family 2, partial [Odoribacter sp.]|nr:glycosyl transferase family 2 [Odoribacter sp.]
MNSFAGFWDSLGSDKFFLVLGSVFFVAHVFFLIYRCVLLVRNQERKKEEEGVSVVITCSNKAELLKENLPAYLEQDYPSYEVIVVD